MTRFLNKIFFWLPLHTRIRSDGLKITINFAYALAAIAVAWAASSYLTGLITARVAAAREKLLIVRAIEERQALFLALNEDYKRLSPIFPQVYSALPKPEEVLKFASAIEAHAQNTGNVPEFRFSTGEPEVDSQFPDLAKVRFSLTLQSNQEAILRFLKGMRSLPYFVTFDGFRLAGPSGIVGNSGISLNGTLYIQKQ